MRLRSHALLLLALDALSRRVALSVETEIGTPGSSAAVSQELTPLRGLAVGDSGDSRSQVQGGDDRRDDERGPSDSSRVQARWPTPMPMPMLMLMPPGRHPGTVMSMSAAASAASAAASLASTAPRNDGVEDQSSGGRFGGALRGEAGGGAARGRHFGASRLPRQSEAATFFNSLDENSDGVLAENEIREFVGYVGGSTLDDNSEILGGVSSVMGRLDTDSEEGIGLKELSSWINRLGSMLTVEEAAEWVTHAVQLPAEVAEAFRSNSISAYDFPELVEDNGAGLYDLGIKRKFRKRIVKAIEIRLLGLGDEPPRPVLHPPEYLGAGKVRVEWSAGGLATGQDRDNHDDVKSSASSSSSSPLPSRGQAAELVPAEAEAEAVAVAVPPAADGGDTAVAAIDPAGPEGEGEGEGRQSGRQATAVAGGQQGEGKSHSPEEVAPDRRQLALPPPPPPQPRQPPRAATFPVHKYVLQRSCLPHYSPTARSASTTDDRATAETPGGGSGNGGGTGVGRHAERFGESAAAGNDGGWVTVHEADDVGFIAASSSFVFVDSGLSPGKTYLYRVRAWNLIGHSEAPTAHVTTPAVPSLWTKPWRVISPWLRTGNGSTASSSAAPRGSAASLAGSEAASSFPQSTTGGAAAEVGSDGKGGDGFSDRGLGVEPEDQGGRGWRELFAAAWSVLSWVGWGVAGLVQALHAVLVLATVHTNLTRLCAAYGRGGTGTALRRNWVASLVWKLNHVVTRNRLLSGAIGALNDRLEQAIGLPPLAPSAVGRGLRRQRSTRNSRDGSGEPRGGRSWSSSSRPGSREHDHDHCSSGEEDAEGLVRIDEEYSSVGVGVGIRGREAQYYHARRVGYLPATPGDGGGGARAPQLGRRRSSPSMAWLQRQIYRSGKGEREEGFPVEAGGQGRAEPSTEFSPYATRADIPDGRTAGGGHIQERRHSRSSSRSSRGSSTRHRHLRSYDQEEQDTVDLDLNRARAPSNASVRSASSLFSSSSSSSSSPVRRIFLEGSSAERSGDRRREGLAGAGGAEEPRPAGRRGWFGWGKGMGTADGVGGAAASLSPGAGAAGAEMMMHRRGENGRSSSFGLSEEYLDGIVGDGDEHLDISDGGLSDGYTFAGVGGGDPYGRRGEGDAGGVGRRPTLERSGSSMDFRRGMPHFRKSSVSRLALGLKKGQVSGRDAWRKEAQAAEACFFCHKPFKTVTRQRHHCGRCHRVFCSKHGSTPHVKGSVCSVPGDCVCDVCLGRLGGGGGGDGGGDNILDDGGAYGAPEPRRPSFKPKIKPKIKPKVKALKAESEAGAAASIGSGHSAKSEAGEGRRKRGRRFGWGRSASFGQLRRTRRAPSDQSLSLSENKEEEAFLEPAIASGSGGANHRSNDANNPRSTLDARPTAALRAGSGTPSRVASGRAVAGTASPSADGSSPATVHDYRALAAGSADAGDVIAGGPDEAFLGEARAGRVGWGGVFARAGRRITR